MKKTNTNRFQKACTDEKSSHWHFNCTKKSLMVVKNRTNRLEVLKKLAKHLKNRENKSVA
jgi:hypothetical protein